MVNNNQNEDLVQYNQVEEAANIPRFATEEEILASFGYKQEMNKTMSTISNFSIAFGCCSILSGLTPVSSRYMSKKKDVHLLKFPFLDVG